MQILVLKIPLTLRFMRQDVRVDVRGESNRVSVRVWKETERERMRDREREVGSDRQSMNNLK